MIANGKWWGYVLGLFASYLGGFILTYFFGIPQDKLIATNNAINQTNDTSQPKQVVTKKATETKTEI
ncbi:hypothetical protein, partial [Melissococcus plutonius]|uniref:Uncharacterized protein n=1 Tax=Melissococcus plutonius (strain ATCC 35311 / DSM 29964 / CIP 104052 / LMG 20360 / NCIMB 702443) TaxID=940190 RepID=F3Y8J3_MELPT|nr:PTS system sucrose-specific IIC component [Melissococcus plutonius]BAK20821.1 hypothetical protein MPTP_0337 [Melissococcus plutonius ATCC 35311]